MALATVASAQVTDLCLGAFQDAFWLRWYNPRSLPRRILRTGSASRCSVSLAVWTAISFVICLSLPGARKAMSPSPYRDARWTGDDFKWRLCRHTGSDHTAPGLSIMEDEHSAFVYRHCLLSTDTQASAYCHASRYRTLRLAGQATTFSSCSICRPRLIAAIEPSGQYAARLFLSQAAWRELFGSDAGVIGNHTEIGGQRVLIAGVIAQDSSQLPGQVDAWLLEDEQHLDMLPRSSKGFVVAHMRTSGSTAAWMDGEP